MKLHPEAFRERVGAYGIGCYVKNESKITISRFIKRNDIYKVFHSSAFSGLPLKTLLLNLVQFEDLESMYR